MTLVPFRKTGTMANKSTNMMQIRRIIQLKAEGLSKLKISESLHIHRATLENYLLKLLTSAYFAPDLSSLSASLNFRLA